MSERLSSRGWRWLSQLHRAVERIQQCGAPQEPEDPLTAAGRAPGLSEKAGKSPWSELVFRCFSVRGIHLRRRIRDRERAWWWSAPLTPWFEKKFPFLPGFDSNFPILPCGEAARADPEMREPLRGRGALAGSPRRAWKTHLTAGSGRGGSLLSRDRSCRRTLWINSAPRCTCPRLTWSSRIQQITCCVTTTASGCGGLSWPRPWSLSSGDSS